MFFLFVMGLKEYLFGTSVVIAALQQRRRRLFELFINPKSQNEYINTARVLAEQNYIPVTELNSARLDRLSESRPNQGMVLMTSSLPSPSIQYMDFPTDTLRIHTVEGCIDRDYNREHPILICLDRIMDPQNVGAILRTAYFFGVDGIVKTTKDSSPLTPIVSKASAGSLENMDVYTTSNMGNFLRRSSDNGWIIYGTNLSGDNVLELDGESPLPPLFKGPTILVVSNEGSGMKPLLSNLCDVHLKVMGFSRKAEGYHVDSLNVSVATGILLQKILEQQ
jgi:21S rRNA (GM2251-2'-O)-methyltransferase